MNLPRISFRMLVCDWRAGELNLLLFALVIAVGGIATVGFFVDRVQLTLSRQGNQLLGADLIIVSDHQISQHYTDEALRLGLVVSNALKFPSMVAKGENSLLTEIKAVATDYPLRGELRISDNISNVSSLRADYIPNAIPSSGSVWVDDKLANRLTLKQGDTIEVGATKLTVTALITQEPDHSIGFISLAPRLLINAVDLPATNLIKQGSRVTYRLLIAGDAGLVKSFKSWAQARLVLGEKIEDIRDARPEIKTVLERAEKFLSLAAMASVVLATVAIALAVRQFILRHLDTCAVMRCLGTSQKKILKLYLYYFIMFGIAASSIGCVLGLISQEVLTYWLSTIAEVEIPPPSLLPAIHGLLFGMAILLGFALPPLLNLKSVPALRVLHRDIGSQNTGSLAGYATGLVTLLVLFLWQAGDAQLGISVMSTFIFAVVVFGFFGFLMIKILSSLLGQTRGAWHYGLASILRRTAINVVQIIAIGLGIMALLTLTLIQNNFLQDWRAGLPSDTPNYFLVNIQTDQLRPLENFFEQNDILSPTVFPMVRGRLISINNKIVLSENYFDTRAKRLIEREFNLSWAEEIRSDNKIIAGHWWENGGIGEAVVSIEEGVAKTIGIHLGDVLTYEIAGQILSVTVTSLRKVNWDSFRVNFFVVTPPSILKQYPATYITSLYLQKEQLAVINKLVKNFPNFLVIDVEAIIAQVQKIMEQVTKAIEFVFLFTLLSGLAVLYAAIVTTHDERVYEAAIFRVLGANRRQLVRVWVIEFAILGGLAGLLAAIGASSLNYIVGKYALNMPYTFNSWVFLTGLLFGGIGVVVVGLIGTRGALTRPPLQTLRKIA